MTAAGATEPVDRARAIADLEAALAATPRAHRPHERAVLLYRLGLAHAEGGAGADGLRRALACYEEAADLFDPRFDPVEHARVLNAAGAALRAVGNPQRAQKAFADAAELFGRGGARDAERAAALNNLALASVEIGDPQGALEACAEAIPLFDPATDEGRRGRAAALQTQAMAHMAGGSADGLRAAIADFEHAMSAAGDDAPFHWATASHGLGTASSQLAALVDGDERRRSLDRAAGTFADSLTVFTRAAFPLQHAMAKYNLGLVHAARGGPVDLRRALACFEDAVAILDPRVHRPAWTTAYRSLERTEQDLAAMGEPGTRAEQFAALLGTVDAVARSELLRERLHRLLASPDARRHLAELATAVARLPSAADVIATELDVLMELPKDRLEVALRATVDAHRALGDGRAAADEALDRAIGDALGVPQRVFVRDFLYSIGWERP